MKQHNKKIKLIAFMIAFALLSSSLSIAQFPWQFDDKIIPFSENSELIVKRLKEIAQEYKEKNPLFFYELSRRVEFIHYFSNKVDFLRELYTKNLIPFLMLDPKVENPMIINLINFSISLLGPLYILSLLTIAVYLLFVSGSPKGRAKAKATLIKLIIGLGIIMLTSPIIQVLLEFSHLFSSLILSLFVPDTKIFSLPISFFMSYFMITTFFKPITGSIFLLFSITLPIGVLVVLAFRYFLVILLTIFFPFSIFLYSFSPVRGIGKRALFQTCLWIFLPIIDSLILGIVSISFFTFPIEELRIFISVSGFLLLIFSPLIMMGVMNFIIGTGEKLLIEEKIK